jgi:hypothetical protein
MMAMEAIGRADLQQDWCVFGEILIRRLGRRENTADVVDDIRTMEVLKQVGA